MVEIVYLCQLKLEVYGMISQLGPINLHFAQKYCTFWPMVILCVWPT